MKGILFTSILTFVLSCEGQTQDLKNTSNTEPRSGFEVNINGKIYKALENEEFTIDTLLLKPKITIKLSANKKFDNSSISFEYPRNLSFEFTQDFGYKNWTLSGNSLVVLVFEIDAKTQLTNLVNEMISKFGKENCVVEDFQNQLGSKKCNGKRINVSLAGQKLVLECYEIKLDDFKSRFIYFQDTLEDNVHSKEFSDGFKVIGSTIIFR